MEPHKISVVVPIFKVEKYLNRCIDSIINQTYNNLEIILVNDGSPDQCGKIADKYGESDCRVKVLHKSNGGLSDARNFGMKHITGDYTLFVDSDDWLEHTMIAEMVKKMLEYGVDIVQSAFYYAYEDHLLYDNRYYQKDDSPVVLGNQALMTELVINERVKNFAWGKLYKTELIRDIPFKKGVLFEDVFWAHQVMQRVESYVILHKPMCYYYQRSDSIVSTYTPKNLDIIKGLMERHHFIEEYYEDLTNKSLKVILNTCLIHYNLLLLNKKKDKGAKHRKEIQNYIKSNYWQFKKSVKDDDSLRRQLLLFSIHPFLNICFLVSNKMLRKLQFIPVNTRLEKIPIKDK